MSTAKHTPGNWTAREGTTTGCEVVGKKPRGGDYVIARCGGKDREHNARLIAAAPDLLDAVLLLLEEAEASQVEGAGWDHGRILGRKAVLKATAETGDVDWSITERGVVA